MYGLPFTSLAFFSSAVSGRLHSMVHRAVSGLFVVCGFTGSQGERVVRGEVR